MSLQEEALQQTAARVIQKAWRRYLFTEIFKCLKDDVSCFSEMDPKMILKAVNPREGELLDAAAGVYIRFRFGGITFPPNIYYKIFTHRPIVDLCAANPRDYTQAGLKMPVPRQTHNGWPLIEEDRSRWYQRIDNNSWRLFSFKAVPAGEPREIGAKRNCHQSLAQPLLRWQDVTSRRKKRRVERMKEMYKQGRQLTEEWGDEWEEDEMAIEKDVDELLAWTNNLNIEDYIEEWKYLACSQSSDPFEDLHIESSEAHQFAGMADNRQ